LRLEALKLIHKYFDQKQAFPKISKNFFNDYAKIKPVYSITEIISNLVKLKVDRKIIAEALEGEVGVFMKYNRFESIDVCQKFFDS
jgi:hypothetical protein